MGRIFVEETIHTGQIGLNVARTPESGPPLLLLHGVLRRWSDFLPLVPALATRWQLFLVDLRGHGASEFRPGNYRVLDYVTDIGHLLKDFFSDRVTIYGHSLGAMVAAAAAARWPDSVRGLIMEDPPFHTMGNRIKDTVYLSQFSDIQALLRNNVELFVPEQARQLAELQLQVPDTGRSIRMGDVRDASALRYVASCLEQVDPDVLTPIVDGQWLDGYNTAETFAQVTCPSLVMQADPAAGGMLSESDLQSMNASMADLTSVRFPGVGHLIHWADTAGAIRVALNFLESLR